ncbi:hypothetical protein OAS86_05030 [Gammaproteobacteria bacterium]|nr:hypothetical protein [Gammaproteobacteria bacterium]
MSTQYLRFAAFDSVQVIEYVVFFVNCTAGGWPRRSWSNFSFFSALMMSGKELETDALVCDHLRLSRLQCFG